MKILTLVLGYILFATAARAEALVWKTEAELQSMTEVPGCDPDKDADCHDVVKYAGLSTFGTKVYITYYEGVRMQLGFGMPPDGYGSIYLAGQLHPGAYDWGGRVVDGVFKPVFVIKRFYEADLETFQANVNKTYLTIFRLMDGAAACAITTQDDIVDNAKARQLAEASIGGTGCTE